MNRSIKMLLLAIVSIILLNSCSSKGGTDNPPSDVELSGLVTDERVSGAEVLIYSDKDMSILIGSGITDADGAFTITLKDIKEEPSIIYAKTVGGLNINDMMPAPSMNFIGNKDITTGKYNISPISSILYEKVLGGHTLDQAQSKVEVELESAVGSAYSQSELYIDPSSTTNGIKALDSILASSISTVSLSDGDYKLIALIYTQKNIEVNDTITDIVDLHNTTHLKKLNINITNHFITGTCGTGCAIKGSISGSNFLINFLESGSSVTKIAGTVGLFGSASGTFVDMEMGKTKLNKGVFAAQFIPSSGVNYAQMETKIAKMIIGPISYIFRDYIGNSPNIVPGSTDLSITNYNSTTHTFTSTGFSNHVDNDSTPAGFNNANVGVPFDFKEGKLLEVDGHITSLALFKYQVHPNGDYTYLVKPIGIRSGVDMLVDGGNKKLIAVGDAIFNRTDVIAPSINSGENTMKVYVVGPQNLNHNRPITAKTSTLTIPSGDTATIQRANALNTTITLSKGVVAMYFNQDATMNLSTDLADYLRFLQFSNTGAFQGENLQGGSIGGIPLSNWPMPFVGNMHKISGGVVPSVFGREIHLNYLARTLYTTEFDVDDYSAFGAGTLSINGDTATMTIKTTSDGVLATPIVHNLTADFDSAYGIYHIYGATGDTTTDIYWAIGSTKAVFTSTYENTDVKKDKIREVGEAFLSF